MNVQTDNPTTETAPSPEDARSIERIRAILAALLRYVAGRKIYAKNNPTVAKFASTLKEEFDGFFSNEDELVLTIEKTVIKWHESVVYEKEECEENLAFLLYKDGVGEVSFHKGISNEEITRFVDVIKDEFGNILPDEDTVTKLWRADLENINYRVLDEYLVGEFGDGRRDDDEKDMVLNGTDHNDLPSFEDKGRVIVSAQGPLTSIDDYLHGLAKAGGETQSQEQAEAQFENLMESYFRISSVESDRCCQELQLENEQDKLVEFLELAFDFTLLEDRPIVARDAVNIIERLIHFVLKERKPDAMRQTLEKVHAFLAEKPFGDSEIPPLFDELEEQFADTALLLSMTDGLAEQKQDAKAVFGYFRAVGRRSAPAICASLEHLKGRDVHKLACDVLLEVARDEIPQIVEKFDIENPRIAEDALYLLTEACEDTLPNFVGDLLFCTDSKVREGAINYLARIASDEAVKHLVLILDQGDKHTRQKALKSIGDLKHPLIRRKIEEMAFDKNFSKRPAEEQDRIFTMLGSLSGDDVITKLRDMVNKKGLLRFSVGKNRNQKLLVIRALEKNPSAESVALLRELAEDSNNVVNAKSRRAIERISQLKAKMRDNKGGGAR